MVVVSACCRFVPKAVFLLKRFVYSVLNSDTPQGSDQMLSSRCRAPGAEFQVLGAEIQVLVPGAEFHVLSAVSLILRVPGSPQVPEGKGGGKLGAIEG